MQCFLRKNECLSVGSVQISVLDVFDDSVVLGINDPDATPSYREEVLYIRSENDDTDEGDEVDSAFEPFQSETFSPFAISVL